MLKIIQASLMCDDPAADVAFGDIDEMVGRFQVIQTGDTVSVSVRLDNGKYQRVDQLTSATHTDPKPGRGGWTFTGISQALLETGIKREDAMITFTVEGKDGCPTCH